MSNLPPNRTTVGFSADGRHAAWLATDITGRARVEGWTLSPHGPRRTFQHPAAGVAPDAYAVGVRADQVLFAWLRHGERQLRLLSPTGVLAAESAPVLQAVLPAPAGHGLAIGLTSTADGGTAIYRIADDLTGAGPGCEPMVRSPLRLYTPILAGERVVFYARVGTRVLPVIFDPQAATVNPLALPAQAGDAVPVCAAGDQVVLGLSTEGRNRLAVVTLSQPNQLDLLDGAAALVGRVRPLALRPDGAELALRVRHGARSRLLLYRRETGHTREIDVPPGTPEQAAAWTDAGLWGVFSATAAPAALWWLPPGGQSLLPPPRLPLGRSAHVESLPGPAGPIEAVVYGDWRTAKRVVLALHGGPAEHWQLRFDPKLQALAAGAAVVAPNQRGSTGYGREHELAIKGAWGGPDLADILAIGAHLAKVREESAHLPSLYGVSYGAFLALLAMAVEPQRWSGCAAVAPFLSGAELRAATKPTVRALIDRLDGTAPVADEYGPRDLRQVAAQIRGRVLLMHGDQDERIPVTHSRHLAAVLSQVPGVQLTYREVTGRGHDPVLPNPESPELAELVRFLCTDPLPNQPAYSDIGADRLVGSEVKEGDGQYGFGV